MTYAFPFVLAPLNFNNLFSLDHSSPPHSSPSPPNLPFGVLEIYSVTRYTFKRW